MSTSLKRKSSSLALWIQISDPMWDATTCPGKTAKIPTNTRLKSRCSIQGDLCSKPCNHFATLNKMTLTAQQFQKSCWRRWAATRPRNWLRTRVSTLLCRSEEHTSELQSQSNLVCRLLLEKKKISIIGIYSLCNLSDIIPALKRLLDSQHT